MSKKSRQKQSESQPVDSRTLIIVGVGLAVLSAAGIYGHVQLSADPNHIHGMPLVLNHLFNILVAGGMFALFFASGRRVLTLCGFDWNSFAEEATFSTAVGAGSTAVLILLAALAGLLNPYVVGAIFLLELVLCGKELLRLAELARAAIGRDFSSPLEVAYILAFAVLVLVMILRALTPPHAVDEAIYHLAAVKRFVDARSLVPLYDIAQGNSHMLANMLFAPCLMIGADVAAKLLSVGFSLLIAISLYAYARRFLNQATGYVAAIALFGAGMVVEVAITARIDIILAGFLFFATYAMIVYLEERNSRWLWLSAFFSGVAVGIKLTGLLWVGILGLVYLFETLFKSPRTGVVPHIKQGLVYVAILVVLVSPWLIKNYVYFRDPFYPFAHGETVTDQRNQPVAYFSEGDDDKLDRYFQATRERNPQSSQRIAQILGEVASRRIERNPLMFWGYFTNPTVYNVGEPGHTPNYLFVLCPLFLLFTRDRRLILLAVASVAFFVLMAWSAWTARYLLPLYPPLTLIAAYTVVSASDWLKRKSSSLGVALIVVSLVLTTGLTILRQAVSLVRNHELNYVNGSLSRADYLRLVFYYPVLRYANENLPPEAKLLMVGSQMGYDLERSYIADTTWEATPWRRLLLKADNPDSVRDAMKAEGITHVIYSPELYVFATSTGTLSVAAHRAKGGRPDYYEQLRNWTTFEEFKTKFLEPVYKDQNLRYSVFKLR